VHRWRDPHSGRDVWLCPAASVEEWPREPPWSSAGFGLLVAADHAVDAKAIAKDAVARGVAFVCTWGPGCAIVEEAFDEAIVSSGREETKDDVVLTTSHAEESLEEVLEFFLDAATPSRDRVEACGAWLVFAVGEGLGERFERALRRRGAKRDG
jgi:hypothetical protein